MRASNSFIEFQLVALGIILWTFSCGSHLQLNGLREEVRTMNVELRELNRVIKGVHGVATGTPVEKEN